MRWRRNRQFVSHYFHRMIIYQSEVWGLIIVLVHEGQIEVSHFYEETDM